MLDLSVNEAKQFWLEKISDDFSVTASTPDHNISATDKSDPETVPLKIPAECQELITQKTNDSPFLIYTVLMAALNICLYKHTKSRKIVVGSPARIYDEVEENISNALPVINIVEPAQSVKEFLKIVRNSLVEAYKYQHFDYKNMISELKLEEQPDRFQLFDVSLSFAGVHDVLPIVNNNINLLFSKSGKGLEGAITFKSKFYKSETIERFAEHFVTVLTDVLKDLEKAVELVEILPAEERERQLNEWSGSLDLLDLDGLTAVELFEKQVDSAPDSIAAVFDDTQITYAELDAAANRLAHFLLARSIAPEQRVAIMLERGIEMLAAVLGVLKCGAVYLPLDAAYPPERLAYMIEDAAPELVLTETALEGRLPWTAAEVVRLDEARAEIESAEAGRPSVNIERANGAYMIYTSGSTGKPKGVMVTHGGLEALAKEQGRRFGIGAGSRVLQFASLSFDASVFDLSMALFNGGTLYLADRETLLPSRKMTDYLAENEISIITVTPTALSALPFAELPNLKTINVAGEACSFELAGQWSVNRDFFNLYGPTESTIWATIFKFDKKAERISIGKPIKNTEAYLLDDRMNPAPVGVAGEIYLGGAGLARGYWGKAGLTAERFVPHPFGKNGERLYKTGDLGRFLPDGQIEYLGRADRQVKIRGYRVEPGEIESVLCSFENVKEAVVNPNSDDKGNIWLTAYIVQAEGEDFNAAQIRENLQDLLPNYMVPTRFVSLAALPLLPNGKLDRKNLPEANDAEAESEAQYLAPSTEAEAKIAEIWCEILNLKRVGIDDNFFTLGGHSLLLAQVHARVLEIAKKEISLIDLFKYPTIRALASYIAQEGISETDAGRAQERAGTRLELRNKQAALRKRARETESGK